MSARIVVGFGALGQRAVMRLDARLAPPATPRESATIGPEGRMILAASTALVAFPAGIRDLVAPCDAIARAIEALYRTGQTRLDLVCILDGALDAQDARVDAFSGLRERIDALVRQLPQFNVTPGVPPEQRNVHVHFVIVAPALRPVTSRSWGDPVFAFVSCLEVLRRDVETASASAFARAWVIGRSTLRLRLEDGDVEGSCAALASVLGRADADASLLRQLDPYGTAGVTSPIAFAAVASATFPRGRTIEYATWRALYDGFTTLSERVSERSMGGATVRNDVVTSIASVWQRFAPVQGAAETANTPWARTLLVAARASGAPSDLPDVIRVGAFDDPDTIRARYADLFVRVRPSDAVTHSTDILDQSKALDREEADGVEHIRQYLEQQVTDRCGKEHGLRTLPEVEVALRHLIETTARETLRETSDPLTASSADAGLPELQMRVATLPDRRNRQLAFLTGAFPTMLVVGMFPGFGGPASAWAWGGALVAAGVAGALAVVGASRAARIAVAEALTVRRDAMAERLRQGGSGPQRVAALAALGARHERVRRSAENAAHDLLARIQAVKLVLGDGRKQALDRMERLQVQVTPQAQDDLLEHMIASNGRLHRSLVGAATLAGWASRHREYAELDRWADELVGAGWPEKAILEDAPAADEATRYATATRQVRPLIEARPMQDEALRREGATRVRELLYETHAELAPPTVPIDSAGQRAFDAVNRGHGGRQLLLCSTSVRDIVAQHIADLQVGPPIPCEVEGDWVVLLSVWNNVVVDDIARAVHILEGAP